MEVWIHGNGNREASGTSLFQHEQNPKKNKPEPEKKTTPPLEDTPTDEEVVSKIEIEEILEQILNKQKDLEENIMIAIVNVLSLCFAIILSKAN